jgi:hypothetical protein
MDVPHMANPAVAFTRRADVEGFVAIATVGHSLLAANVAGVGAFGLADIALALADSVGEFASSVPLLLLRWNRERNCIHCYQVLTLCNRLVVLHRTSDHPTRYLVDVVINQLLGQGAVPRVWIFVTRIGLGPVDTSLAGILLPLMIPKPFNAYRVVQIGWLKVFCL